MRKLVFTIFLLCLAMLQSCDTNRVYEKYESIDDYLWSSEQVASFEVEIQDTGSLYNLYINVRHAFFYEFSNLWVIIYTTLPNGTELEKRVQLPLADKKGVWYGDCLGDICDSHILIQENAIFDEPGLYTFRLEQNMRKDPLPGVMDIGMRIERSDAGPDIRQAQ